MSAETDVAAAGQAVDHLVDRARETEQHVRAWQRSDAHTAEHKQAQVSELNRILRQDVAKAAADIDQRLDAATADIDRTLRDARASDSAHQAFVAPRAREVLNSLGPGAAAELFADEGDAAALRIVYNDIPAFVAKLRLGPTEQAQRIAGLRAVVEAHLEQHGTAVEVAALRARRNVEQQRDRLTSASRLASNQDGPSRIRMAYADGPLERPEAPPVWDTTTAPSWVTTSDSTR